MPVYAQEASRDGFVCRKDFRHVGEESEEHHGDDGSDGGESDESETFVRARSAADMRDAEPHRDDEGHRHRSRRHAAAVKGEREKRLLPEEREDESEEEDRAVGDEEKETKGDPEDHAEHREGEEDTDADRHEGDQYPFIDAGGESRSEHREIGLCDGDDRADQYGDDDDDGQISRLGRRAAHELSDGDHRHVRADREERHSADCERTSDEEREQGGAFRLRHGQGKNHDDRRDRQDG